MQPSMDREEIGREYRMSFSIRTCHVQSYGPSVEKRPCLTIFQDSCWLSKILGHERPKLVSFYRGNVPVFNLPMPKEKVVGCR